MRLRPKLEEFYHMTDRRRSRMRWTSAILALAALTIASPAFAVGTYSEGWMEITLRKFESRGIFFDSWEGKADFVSYDSGESCSEEDHECYTPTTEEIEFSVRPETRDAINALRGALDKPILVRYRKHRIEPLGLDTRLEILEAVSPGPRHADMPERKVVSQSGGQRNFSVYGRFLRLDRQGVAVKTYEGLYLDAKTNRVHPFSVTNEEMAEHIYRVMQGQGLYYFGVSQAYVTGLRRSDYDIFEVNLNEAAGAPE